jgi:hypothetical protein
MRFNLHALPIDMQEFLIEAAKAVEEAKPEDRIALGDDLMAFLAREIIAREKEVMEAAAPAEPANDLVDWMVELMTRQQKLRPDLVAAVRGATR